MKKLIAFILASLLSLLCAFALADDGWTCPNCGTLNEADALFCYKCVTPKPESGGQAAAEYNAWVCPTCGRIRPNDYNFCTSDATPRTDSTQGALLISTNEPAADFYAPEAVVEVYPIRMDSESGVSIPLWTDVKGSYVVWVTDSVDGYSTIAYFLDRNKNEVGEWPTKRSEGLSSINNRAFAKELEGGQQYTLMLLPDNGFDRFKPGSFTLNLARPTQEQYISGYDLIHDSFVSQKQENRYVFTPEVSGLYGLTCTEAYNGVQLHIEVYDQLNNEVRSTDYYTRSVRMNESLQYELEAGKTYMIYVTPNEKNIGAYTLEVGYQNETVDVSGCEVIGDKLSFSYQQNEYTYTAPSSGDYAFSAAVMDRRSDCSVRVYDEYGNVVFGRNSWDTSCTLQGGRQYRIVITNYTRSDADYICDYVLSISRTN